MSEKAMGFYELQDIRRRCWERQDAGEQHAPLFTSAQMLEVLDEVARLRSLIVDIRASVKDATPDHTA